MQQDIIFIPLGGGQRVGASCYYLKVGDANIILDAGIGIDDGLEFGPDFQFLIRTPFIQSMTQINIPCTYGSCRILAEAYESDKLCRCIYDGDYKSFIGISAL